jgi:retron-type reverse transcriptase
MGSPGIDGMTVDELKEYLKDHWSAIREQLLEGHYMPQPVKQVLIPKPGGEKRMLGITTVLNRFMQQGLLQVLNPLYDPTFSPYSYKFRPRRNAHQAVRQAKEYIAQGHEWVVDIARKSVESPVMGEEQRGGVIQFWKVVNQKREEPVDEAKPFEISK